MEPNAFLTELHAEVPAWDASKWLSTHSVKGYVKYFTWISSLVLTEN